MVKNLSKTRYEARVMKYMEERHGDKFRLMQGFTQSEPFVALRQRILDHYFAQKTLGVVFCVDALVLLVDRVIETVEHDVHASQAA